VIVNCRPCHVNRLINIIVAIHVNVTNDLNLDNIIPVALDLDGRDVLKNITFKHRLYDDKVCIAFDRFNYTKVIDSTVAIEVEIRDLGPRIVESSFKIFEVSRIPEN
jgi:hypothetical protein